MMEEPIQQIKVGIGVMIFKDEKVLLGKRKNAHGEGEYAFPGGHLKYMESFEACAKRETREECEIEIKDVSLLFLGNLKDYAPKHYVQIGLIAQWENGEPKVLEPEKSEKWGWYELDKLPSPLFRTVPLSLKAYKTGKKYFDF